MNQLKKLMNKNSKVIDIKVFARGINLYMILQNLKQHKLLVMLLGKHNYCRYGK